MKQLLSHSVANHPAVNDPAITPIESQAHPHTRQQPGKRRAAGWLGHWLLPVLGLALCALYLLPLARAGYPFTHDRDSYPLRILGLAHAIAAGQWDGRWLADFAKGMGYPLFNFYPPGFAWIGVLFHWAGLSCADAAKAASAVFSLAGSLGMFLLGRRLWRSAAAGFLIALLWTFFPYRILNLYVRGDLAELAALSLMPWALLGHLCLLRGGRMGSLVLAAGAHGAIFALHNISALLFQPLLLAFDLFFFLAERPRGSGFINRRTLALGGHLLAAQALALFLGMAFWLPAFMEKNQVYIGALIRPGSPTDVREQLLWPGQLFDTRWDWGDALPGPDDQVSFQLGWATLAGLAAGGLAMVWRWTRRRSGLRAARPARRVARPTRRLLALAALALPVLFLTLQPSRPFWAHVRLAAFVQFPWRLLGLAGLLLPLMAGPAAGWLRWLPRHWRLAALLLAGVAVPVVVWAYLAPARWLHPDDAGLEEKLRTEYVTTAANNEYLPRTTPYFNAFRPEFLPATPGTLRVERGIGEVLGSAVPTNGLRREFKVQLTTPAILVWTHYYFPGWLARVDGIERSVAPSYMGNIALPLEAGPHQVEFLFGDTVLRFAAKFTSELTLAVLVSLLLIARRRTKGIYLASITKKQFIKE